MSTADKVYPALAAVIAAVTFPRSLKRAKVLALAVLSTPLGIVGALVVANGWAAVLSVIGWKQTW
jgi:mannose/fructose/N-acetylgalactosamine-specific phosphotransferase system component IIC